MEDTELEEGEACSYHYNFIEEDHDYDANIDPDIALSYIGEKLQDVLGHFQKDFEGGVSAVNLGAKFGGYGSFLPTYQRSPISSHPRNSPKSQQYNTSKSPNNLQLEGGQHSSVSSSTAPQSLRLETGSTGVSQHALKTSSSLIDSIKQEGCITSTNFSEEVSPRYGSVNKNSANLIDPKMLKVRIKMGSDNLSIQKNAAIYSGLGLDVSPSSSLDESPSDSEGMSHEPQDAFFDSPANILRIMTSFPVHGGLMLSPLSNDLIHLTKKEKLPKDSRSFATRRVLENYRSMVDGSDSIKGVWKISGRKNSKSLETDEISTVSKIENYKDFQSDIDVLSQKGINLETLASEMLVSNTLKFPLLSNSCSSLSDMGKGIGTTPNISKELKMGVVRDVGFDLTKEEQLMPTFTQEDGWIENSKASSAGKAWEDKKASSVDSVSVNPMTDGHCRGEKPDVLVKIESNVSTGMKGQNSELIDLAKAKAYQKAASHEQKGVKLPLEKDSSYSEGKKKVKGCQGKIKVMAEKPKESSRAGSSLTSKSKKGTDGDNSATKGELEDFEYQKTTDDAGDRYRDFFGDIEPEEENQMSSSETSSEDRLKDSVEIEKSTRVTNNMSRERSSGKKIDKVSTSKVYPQASSIAPLFGHESIPDIAPAETAPVVTQENWVCCDKCQKWRLLPFGKNPNDLPEKWLCGMLNWLPGMNRCSFSEEETTNALRALYQVPAPESLQSNLGGFVSNVMLADVQQSDRNGQTFGSHALSTSGKKKHGLKKFPNTNYKDGMNHLSNAMKKTTKQSVTNGNLNDVKRSPIVSELDFLKLNKSSDTAVIQSKMKSKRDQDLSKASKKMRNSDLSEKWMSYPCGATGKAGPGLSNGLPTASSGKNRPNYNEHTSSKDYKHNRKDRVLVSSQKPNNKVEVSLGDGSMDFVKHNNRDVSKKRKMKESHDTQIYAGSLSYGGHQLPDRILAKEEFSENDYRKEKRVRESRFERKESSASKGIGKTDKKGSRRKSQHLGQGIESNSKRDPGSLHPSAVATSSSSKVSGSHKSEANFNEAKGSPVESVSSSPMRVLKPEKLISARRNLTEKDDSADPSFFALAGLRWISEGEDDGGTDRSETERKEKAVDAVHHGSLQPSLLDSQEKDFNHASGDKAKIRIVPSPDNIRHFTNGSADYLCQDTQYPSKTTSGQFHVDDRQNNNYHHLNGSSTKKSGKGSLSWSKDKIRKRFLESNNGMVKVSNSTDEQSPSNKVEPMDVREKVEEKIADKNEKMNITKHDAGVPMLSKSGMRDVKVEAIGQDTTSSAKQGGVLDHEVVFEKKNSLSIPSGGAQNDAIAHYPQPVSESYEGNGVKGLSINASDNDDQLKTQKNNREVDQTNGILHSTSSNPMSSGNRVKDLDAPRPVKRDSSSQAASNAVKEAKNLKHLADRLKNAGSNLESTRLYFEAALKFLHGAALLEICGSKNAKTGEMIQSMQMYSSTAKLCKFCAHEYEKSKDMAAAALAYKCMEVAYMRVIYSSNANANRDRRELQMGLQMIPPGESPSSSASDIDNLNLPTTVEKVPLAKGICSPQIIGNQIIAAQNRPNFIRLLNFAQNVNFAMEASRKSQIAFTAANVSLRETQLSSIKTALDFNFQDIEGLLHLVRLAIEAVGR